MVNKEASIFETSKYVYNLQQFETIRSFAKNILGDKITLNNDDEDQSNLLVKVMTFQKKDLNKAEKKQQKTTHKSLYLLYGGREMS